MRKLLKHLLSRAVEPLTADDEIEHFRLSLPETHTTTIEGDTGWAKRPPAVLKCPECGGRIYQHRSRNEINCPDCWFETSSEEFSQIELLDLICPNCRTRMQDGRRHPEAFDVPEWATCDNCRYHWEYSHFF